VATYFSTFISGLQEAVKTALVNQIKDASIELLLDGLIVYNTNEPSEKIKNIRFFNNSYLLLFTASNIPQLTPELFVRQIINNPQIFEEIKEIKPKKAKTCRIVISQANQMTSLNHLLLDKIEKIIVQESGLLIDRTNPDLELWILTRSEGYGLVGIRIIKPQNNLLEKGELRPELANILCLLSEPSANDVFLDPFSGSGAIPLERARIAPFMKIYITDNDQNIVQRLKIKAQSLKKPIDVNNWDALKLDRLSNGAVNKIVTDPPWGVYTSLKMESGIFYRKMLQEFIRITVKGGILVILLTQKEIFDQLIKENQGTVCLEEKYDILVSGKKSAIYKIIRL